jgi:hypothetical protein
MKETDKAYIAGIIDGEGCIYIAKIKYRKKLGGYRYRAEINVTNTKKELIDFLHRKIPISWICSRQQYTKYKTSFKSKKVKRVFIMRVVNQKQLKNILLDILPYLILKKKNAKNMLHFLTIRELKNPFTEREINMVAKAKFLNK